MFDFNNLSGVNEMKTNESEGHPDANLPNLSEENHTFLLNVAREAIINHVKGNRYSPPHYTDEKLKQNFGAFVTLKIRGQLRGCIGNLESDYPLPENVAELAVKSATMDPRFPPIGPAEVDHLEIEISILGPLVQVRNIEEIVIGRDGLVIEMAGRHGLLLPQVATEHGLDVKEFLAQTCLKAMLAPDSWKRGANIFRFAAEVF